MMSATSDWGGLNLVYGRYGAGPMPDLHPDQVQIYRLEDGDWAPWRALRWNNDTGTMNWATIDNVNASGLFHMGDDGVYDILKYVYDIIYFRHNQLNWPWEQTLRDVVKAARDHARRGDALAFLNLVERLKKPQATTEIGKEVWKEFFELMDEIFLGFRTQDSPPVSREQVPSSPGYNSGDGEYVIGELSDSSDDESDLEEGEIPRGRKRFRGVKSRFEKAVRANDHQTVEKLATRYAQSN